MAKLSLGRRRRRLLLQAPADTPDGAGGVARAWMDVARVWASVEAIATEVSSERDRAERRELAMRYRLSLRWRAGVDGTMRFLDGTRVLRILGAADPDGRRRTLACLVEEVGP